MARPKQSNTAEGCMGCLALLVIVPFGFILWESVGPWPAAGFAFCILVVFGFLVERLKKFTEFQAIKKSESERIRVSELRQRARDELRKQMKVDLSKSGQRQRAAIPEHILEAVFQRDGGQCVLCGAADELQFDHILHHSKGGADSIDNLRLLCRACNQRRGSRFR
jgi:hypothetical protein